MIQPQPGDYAPYFEKYIAMVHSGTPKEIIAAHSNSLEIFFTQLPDDKGDYAYAAGKWTLKDLLQHIIDTERIMSYRLLRISRNDQSPLASFDENSYALVAEATKRTFTDLKEEFSAVRAATDLLILSLRPEQLSFKSTASSHPTSSLALVYILFGHLLHHQQVIKERYL